MMAIRTIVKESPTTEAWHVKGYQDQDPYRALYQWASLNLEVNILANVYWQETRQIFRQQ